MWQLRSISIVLSFILVGLISLPASSQSRSLDNINNSLTVEPALVELEVSSGDLLLKKIKVKNNYNRQIKVEAQVKGFVSASKFGGINFIDSSKGRNKNSAQQWIDIYPSSIDIPAGSSVEYTVEIKVPDGTPAGSYYAAIIFMPKIEAGFVTNSGAKIIPAVGALFLFNLSPGEKIDPSKILIVNDKIDSNNSIFAKTIQAIEKMFGNNSVAVISQPPVKIEFELLNQTNFYIRPKAEAILRNALGRVTAQSQVDLSTVLANSQRFNKLMINLPAKKIPYFGRYTVYLGVAADGAKLSKGWIVWILPVWFLLSTIAIFCLIILFVVKYKKRIARFFSILLRGK